MRTQWWRLGVGSSWSSSRSLLKVSGIFEVRFLPWHGTISFSLHVCECHVLLCSSRVVSFWPRSISVQFVQEVNWNPFVKTRKDIVQMSLKTFDSHPWPDFIEMELAPALVSCSVFGFSFIWLLIINTLYHLLFLFETWPTADLLYHRRPSRRLLL